MMSDDDDDTNIIMNNNKYKMQTRKTKNMKITKGGCTEKGQNTRL